VTTGRGADRAERPYFLGTRLARPAATHQGSRRSLRPAAADEACGPRAYPPPLACPPLPFARRARHARSPGRLVPKAKYQPPEGSVVVSQRGQIFVSLDTRRLPPTPAGSRQRWSRPAAGCRQAGAVPRPSPRSSLWRATPSIHHSAIHHSAIRRGPAGVHVLDRRLFCPQSNDLQEFGIVHNIE
jgi:hypothetical protein